MVPVAVLNDLELGPLLIRNPDTSGIGVGVQFAFHGQVSWGRCGGDEIDYDVMADERFAAGSLRSSTMHSAFSTVRGRKPKAKPGMPGSCFIATALPAR